MIFVVLPSAAIQALMLPVIESKIKSAGAGLPAGGATTKSLVALATAPVGRPPGMVIVCGLALRTTGLPETSPLMSCVVVVPLFATQKGLVPRVVIPHGLTSRGS